MCEELVEDDVLSQSHFSKLQHRIYYVKDTHVYAFLFDAEKTPVWDQHYTQLQISPLSVICLNLNCTISESLFVDKDLGNLIAVTL